MATTKKTTKTKKAKKKPRARRPKLLAGLDLSKAQFIPEARLADFRNQFQQLVREPARPSRSELAWLLLTEMVGSDGHTDQTARSCVDFIFEMVDAWLEEAKKEGEPADEPLTNETLFSSPNEPTMKSGDAIPSNGTALSHE